MLRLPTFLAATLCLLLVTGPALAQEAAAPAPPAATQPADKTVETVKDETGKIVDETKQSVDKIAKTVDQDPRAKEASAGLLTFIYKIAERLSFPAFHWVAFAIMVAGVVSYAFQLVLGKLALLFRGSLNLAEILSDAKALVISLVGLVLTTQAAAENSTFTQSPFAVLSSTAVGAIVGLVFYRWGQRLEVEAAIGRSRPVIVKS
jgi:predicted outer membrane protein